MGWSTGHGLQCAKLGQSRVLGPYRRVGNHGNGCCNPSPRLRRALVSIVVMFLGCDGVLREKVFGPVYGDVLPEKVRATEAAAGP